MFMILFDLLSVYCSNELKVEIYLSEPDTIVPFTNKLMMEASILQKYVSRFLLKEDSQIKILEMDAVRNLGRVCHEVSELYSENVILLEQMHKNKINLENKLRKTKMPRFLRYFKTQLRYKNTQIGEIETMQEFLSKLKNDLNDLHMQLMNPLKTICTETQLKKMKCASENNIDFLLRLYEENITECTKV